MVRKPIEIIDATQSVDLPPPGIVNGAPKQDEKKILSEEKILKRDPCFAWLERPLGMEQHTFHRFGMSIVHGFAAYYVYLYFTGEIKAKTWIWDLTYGYFGLFGVTIGHHRYWSHKTFKAKKPLQWLLMAMVTIAGQYPIFKWSMEHRIHHKYTDTDSDPHNSTRGFWWCHWIWFFYPRHPEFQNKLDTIDMSDLENDPIVRFQSQHYGKLIFLFNLLIPCTIVMYIYDVSLFHAAYSSTFRFVVTLHVTLTVNSIAHVFGHRPYDKNMRPVDNMILSYFTIGEGWHNFHHSFPCDYKTSEFGWKVNFSTMLLDFFAWMGWAYDLKTVSKQVLNARVKRTGDGTHWTVQLQDEVRKHNTNDIGDVNDEEQCIDIQKLSMDHPSWGWDDKADAMQAWRQLTTIVNPEKTE